MIAEYFYFLFVCYLLLIQGGCIEQETEETEGPEQSDLAFDGELTYDIVTNTLKFSIINKGNKTASGYTNQPGGNYPAYSHTIFKLVNSETKETPTGDETGDALLLTNWGNITHDALAPSDTEDITISFAERDVTNPKTEGKKVGIPEPGEYWIILDYYNDEMNEIDELDSIAGKVIEDIVMLSDIDNIDSNNIGKFTVPVSGSDLAFDGEPTYDIVTNTLRFSIINKGNKTASGFTNTIQLPAHSHAVYKLNQTGDALLLTNWGNITHNVLVPDGTENITILFNNRDVIKPENEGEKVGIPEPGEYWIILDYFNDETNEIDDIGGPFAERLIVSEINKESNNIGKFTVPAQSDLAFIDNSINYDINTNTLTFSVINNGNKTAFGKNTMNNEPAHLHALYKFTPDDTVIGVLDFLKEWSNLLTHEVLEPGNSVNILANDGEPLENGEYWILLDNFNVETDEINDLSLLNYQTVYTKYLTNPESNNIGKFTVG